MLSLSVETAGYKVGSGHKHLSIFLFEAYMIVLASTTLKTLNLAPMCLERL